MHDLSLSQNTIGKHIQVFKTFMNEATDRGYNKKMDFRGRKLKRMSEPVEYVYLCNPVRGINNDSTWRSLVLEKQIEGHHILISEQFYQDFWQIEMKDPPHRRHL